MNGPRQTVDANSITGAIQVASDSLMAARADLDAPLFDKAIEQKGYRMIWEQGMFCSCLSLDSGQPDYVCTACDGKGYIWITPQEVRALVTSISGNKDQGKIGLDEIGTAYLTPPSKYKMGYRDRFTFLDFTIKFSEVIRGSNTLKHKLRYPAIGILSVHILGEQYFEGVHFDKSEDGWYIIWREMPIYGDLDYGILYTTNPVYIAIGPTHELRGTYTLKKGKGSELFVKLPDQYMIKREDFLQPNDI